MTRTKEEVDKFFEEHVNSDEDNPIETVYILNEKTGKHEMICKNEPDEEDLWMLNMLGEIEEEDE